MTKINKLGKSTFVIAILSFILVAVLAFGGTYAYFSATAGQAAGKVKTGHLKMVMGTNTVSSQITALGAGDKIVQPGQILVGTTTTDPTTGEQVDTPAALKVTMDTNINYYIRVKFDVDVKTAVGAEHNGILTPDNLLTPDDPDVDGIQNDETVYDSVKDQEGTDNVTDDIAILEILLKVAENSDDIATNGVEWKELTKSWVTGDHDDNDQTEDTRELVDGHTGYFYGTGDHASAPVKHLYNPERDADFYNMEVLVNLQDWVGAHGCQYYMDADITISFQIEVLQADFLDNAKLGVHWGTEEKTAAAPTTVAELHEAWDKAVNLGQTAA